MDLVEKTREDDKEAEHTAGRSRTSVARLEGLLVATLAEIVGTGMDNHGTLPSVSQSQPGLQSQKSQKVERCGHGETYANDAVGANELDVRVLHGALGVALAVSLDVAEVADVSGLVRRSAVSLSVRVDCVARV